jgi:hypothetical protein
MNLVPGLIRSGEMRGILRRAVKDSEIFKQRFRHVAARSFMVLRNYKGREVSVNRQQVRSQYLLDYLASLESVPVIEETYREVLEDVMDIQKAEPHRHVPWSPGRCVLDTVPILRCPSPFGHSIVLAGISDIVMMEGPLVPALRELPPQGALQGAGATSRGSSFEEEKVSSQSAPREGRRGQGGVAGPHIQGGAAARVPRKGEERLIPTARPAREQVTNGRVIVGSFWPREGYPRCSWTTSITWPRNSACYSLSVRPGRGQGRGGRGAGTA